MGTTGSTWWQIITCVDCDMGTFVKKTITGGYKQVPQDEATHYLAETAEFFQAQQDLQKLQTKLQKFSKEAQKREAAIQRTSFEQTAEIRHGYEKQIQKLKEKITVLESAVETCSREREELESAAEACSQKLSELEAQNASLLRIMRERANASRGISPKKAHDGYMIIACRQHRDYQEITNSWEDYQNQSFTYRQQNRFIKTEKIPITSWKISVQTPYPVSLPFDQVARPIMFEMIESFLGEIGCEDIQDQNGPYLVFPNDKCILYRWDYAADLRSGFWTIDLYMTGEPCIPQNRIPNRSKAKTKDGNS